MLNSLVPNALFPYLLKTSENRKIVKKTNGIGKMPPGKKLPGKKPPRKLPPGNMPPRKIAPWKIAPPKNCLSRFLLLLTLSCSCSF